MRLLTGFRDYIATCLLPTRGELVCVSNASDTWKKTKKNQLFSDLWRARAKEKIILGTARVCYTRRVHAMCVQCPPPQRMREKKCLGPDWAVVVARGRPRCDRRTGKSSRLRTSPAAPGPRARAMFTYPGAAGLFEQYILCSPIVAHNTHIWTRIQ